MINKKQKKSKGKNGGVWRKIYRTTLILFTLIVATCLIIASYGGNASPSIYRNLCIMVMTFPIWGLSMIAITILDAIWCRKALIICAITFAICATALWEFSPLNIFSPSEKVYADCPKFTLLTYNVANFSSMDGNYPEGQNPTISYILRSGADVVCIQESTGISAKSKTVVISPEQIDSLNKVYPYILLYGHSQMLLSKYPASPIPLGTAKKSGNEIALFRLDIEGLPITIANVHLQSYSLSTEDKSLYYDLTRMNANETEIKKNIEGARYQLLSKIRNAAEGRATDTDRLMGYIRRFGGPNVIVAGDFNDVPGCYTLRQLEELEMQQVYPEVGLGPMITFNDNRFYFRIDHVLYRGKLKPLSLSSSDHKSSDHNPLLTTFAITN